VTPEVPSAAASPAVRDAFATIPATGDAVEVAPGVQWLRMSLPMALNHINVWALAERAGWTLVDTGMQTPDTATAWQSALTGPGASRRVERVIATHMHPDHIGMAGWLTRRFECRLWMTRLEYVTCRMLVADTGREAPAEALRFYHAAGWSPEWIEHYQSRFGSFGRAVSTLPDSYRRIVDGEELEINGRTWLAVVGRGHSPEHLCLHCPELGVLISGDQVLPRITSNVSVFPMEPDADPLTDWLDSLASISRRVSDDVLVLPSHNVPFYGLHARLAQLISGHEENLERLQRELAQPKRAVDLFSVLFRRRINPDIVMMATGESIAHLNCLMRRGLAARELDGAGIAWYRSV